VGTEGFEARHGDKGGRIGIDDPNRNPAGVAVRPGWCGLAGAPSRSSDLVGTEGFEARHGDKGGRIVIDDPNRNPRGAAV